MKKGIALIAACVLAVLLATAASGLSIPPAFADEPQTPVWENADGETVLAAAEGRLSEPARLSERISSAQVRLQLTAEIADGTSVFALLRDRNKFPDKQAHVRGIYFEFSAADDGIALDVTVVERTSSRTIVTGWPAAGGTVDAELISVSDGSVRLQLDGKRMIDDFDDVTAGISATAYSVADETYVAAEIPEGNALTIVSLEGRGTVVAAKDEWIARDSAFDLALPQTLTAARLTAGQLPQRLEIAAVFENAAQVTLTKSTVFRTADGSQGFLLKIGSFSDRYSVAMSFLHGKTETELFSGYVTAVNAGEVLRIVLRERLSGGYVLELGGERVTIAGKDPLGLFATEDFADGQGKTYLAFESDGEIRVDALSGLGYDPDPIGKETSALNDSELGAKPTDWTDGVDVNDSGVAIVTSPVALRSEMQVDYIGFTVEVLNLVSTTSADCGISFAVSASDGAENAELVAAGANGLLFGLKNKNGVTTLFVQERYDGVLKKVIGDTALTEVDLYAPIRFELVWVDYELRLMINGAEFVNEYGLNPLALYYPKYYRNENKRTYLSFAQNLSAEGTSLTPENATRFAVYGIDNMLPAAYRQPAEQPKVKPVLSALWIAVPAVAAAVCLGSVALAVVLIAKRRKAAKVVEHAPEENERNE